MRETAESNWPSAADAERKRPLRVRQLGRTAYPDVFRAMRSFTDARTTATADELWLTEHEPVFTQGQAGRSEYVLEAGETPVVQSDRGGQVTYHGPGQIVGYLLFDLRRLGIGVHALVRGIERGLVALLERYNICASGRPDAPGVYVETAAGTAKIAALGLRVRRGCSYHGFSLNVDLDLAPYQRIVACGLAGIGATSMARELGPGRPVCTVESIARPLVQAIVDEFGFAGAEWVTEPWRLPAAPTEAVPPKNRPAARRPAASGLVPHDTRG